MTKTAFYDKNMTKIKSFCHGFFVIVMYILVEYKYLTNVL